MTASDKPAFLGLMKRLAIAMHTPIDDFMVKVHYEALQDIPIAILTRAERKLEREADYFPKPVQWRRAADDVQRDLLLALPDPSDGADGVEHCAECDDTGFRPIARASDVRMVEPCACRRRQSAYRAANPLMPRRYAEGKHKQPR